MGGQSWAYFMIKHETQILISANTRLWLIREIYYPRKKPAIRYVLVTEFRDSFIDILWSTKSLETFDNMYDLAENPSVDIDVCISRFMDVVLEPGSSTIFVLGEACPGMTGLMMNVNS